MPDNAAQIKSAGDRIDTHPDPFLADFLARQAPDVAKSFTPEQLQAVKLCFGARQWRAHALDFRRSIRLFGSRFYVVLLAGRERRTYRRLRAEGLISRTADVVAISLAVMVLSLPFLWLLYEIKNAMGINLVTDGGLHATLESFARQIGRMLGR